ncbi:molecular chaperone DnaJ [Actinoalloteichus sp. AHMU CJ021]|uniref:DnaJ domain-containing protein n=1 Tax=Actinoalloteichus caeruleus DSM 43889 TaxID=1120930 RepID=A0ABT1JNU6_ACTCY|nr:DnaJ domain-containing protein [Actinoalloteichus caeruleus]AUS79653.1 molecular chaperone DnaJ [Actinoalloteichus sp. AHMU CJ021]MCP2333808.1 DnaJ domain-containing protein [Actinoalloteichus caeruleus DSM 43889]
MVDHYELLGLSRDATTAEVKSAYRQLAKTMHPDAGGTAGAFRLLQDAYETLTDPLLRRQYDRDRARAAAPPAAPGDSRSPSRWHSRRRGHRRPFGTDPDFVPPTPKVDPDDLDWWTTVRETDHVRHVPPAGCGHAPPLAATGLWAALLALAPVMVGSPVSLMMWLLLVAAAAGWVIRIVRRQLAASRTDRAFAEEFGDTRVFGRPGAERDEVAEQLTADLLTTYLTRIPGVRIFHGLAMPDSVFSDVDHAVLCGRRLVLVESRAWLPGHYAVDEDGELWRNGHPFRGGSVRLPDVVAAYRRLLPGVEVRGALLLYPSRAGEITTEEDDGSISAPMTPERFVDEVGAWLAEDPTAVDADLFKAVLNQVVSASARS